MIQRVSTGRGRLWTRRPGLRVGALLAFTAAAALACDGVPGVGGGDVVQLENGEVRLPAGSERHDVLVSGVGGPGEIEPAALTVRPGDAVTFESGDDQTHAIVFGSSTLTAAQDSFLDASGQLRGPPLLAEGARWVVSFEGAPTGSYRFVCLSHGGQGSIEVVAASPDQD